MTIHDTAPLVTPAHRSPLRGSCQRAGARYGALALLLLPWALLLSGALHLEAQPIVVGGCDAPCPIHLTEEIVLGGGGEDEGSVGSTNGAVRLEDGRWVLVDYPHHLQVFGPEGRPEQIVGRAGQGPGEYLSIDFIRRLPGDTIEVYDRRQFRITQLSPQFEVVDIRRTAAIPSRALVWLEDGGLVMNQILATPESAGLPLHLVDAGGQFVRSFGADPPYEDLRDAQPQFRALAPASENSVWAAHYNRYRVDEWTASGEHVRSLTRETEWFPAQDEGGFVDEESPPNPSLRALHRDDEGLLWVAVWIADEEWEAALEDGSDPYGRPTVRPGNLHEYYDTVIEVIDPEEGRVLGRSRIDLAVPRFVHGSPRGVMVQVTDLADDLEPVVRILRMELPE